MKKNWFLPFVFSFLSFYVSAQPQIKTKSAGSRYPQGYTKNFSPTTTDESLNKVTNVEIKDPKGVVKVRVTYKQDLQNKWTVTAEGVTPSGKTECKSIYRFDENQKLNEYEFDHPGRNGKYTRNTEGEVTDPGYNNGFGKESVIEMEKEFQEDFRNIGENKLPSTDAAKTSCIIRSFNCRRPVEIFGGYSYLSSDYGNENEGFSGFNISALFNISNHVAAGADVSIHTKEFGSENLTRSFYLVQGRYLFGDASDCNIKFNGDVHILAGLGTEKYGSSNGSGFAFGAGGTIFYNISNTIGISGKLDWIGVKFENTDDINKNIRASIGINFWAGQRFYRRNDVHIADYFYFNNLNQNKKQAP